MWGKFKTILGVLADFIRYGRKKEWWEREERVRVRKANMRAIAKRVRGRAKLKRKYGIGKR